jgi:HYDIN/CFA65/VesB family protein/fibronectin type III domain protein
MLPDRGPFTLGPGESRTIPVLYVPWPFGYPDYWSDSTRLLIVHDAIPADQGAIQVPLTGGHLVTDVRLTPGLTFGGQPVGTASGPQTVTVTNSGGAPLAIVGLEMQGLSAGAYAVDSSFLGRLLAPGAAATLGVSFAPTVIGPATGTLSVATNARTSPDAVGLTGTGVMPVLRVSQDTLGFGPEPVGLTGARGLLLQNTGNAPLQIGNIAFAGPNAAEFALAGGTPGSPTLQPGDMTLLNIEFSPAAIGSRSATLVISDNTDSSSHSVLLAGTGTAPLLTLNAAALIFHIPPTGSAPPPQTVTFTNGGDAPLAIAGVALSGADANRFRIVSDSGERRLDPGASRTVQVGFSPATATVASVDGRARIAAARIASVSYSANLEIIHNDPRPGSPHQVMLTALPAVQAAPAAPTGQSVRLVSPTALELSWTDNSDNETGFGIWRKSGAGAWVRIGDAAPNTTRFVDRGLNPETTYTYRVRAHHQLVSSWSNEASGTTAPSAPRGLSVRVVSSTRLELNWQDCSARETAFAIWRKSGAGSWMRIGVVAPNATRFVDIHGGPGTTYTYRVRAINGQGASAWTGEVSGTTLPH